MALNQFLDPLPRFDYQQPEDSEDLIRAVNLQELRVHINADVTVAGGTTNGDVVPDSPASLIDYIRVVWDGLDLVQQISGRDLVALTRRCVAEMVEPSSVADGAVQASTNVSADFIIPFARPYLANPYDTVLPALQVRQQFRIYVKWNTGKTTATSDPGSSAIIRGGDRVVTLANVYADVLQLYSTKPFTPWYIPILSVVNAEQFVAADSALPLRLRNRNRFDSIMIRSTDGANADPANLINNVTFMAGNQRYYDRVDVDQLKTLERNRYPAVPSRVDEPGTIFLPFADGGKLTNVVNPTALRLAGSDPRIELDIDAPTAPSGNVRAIMMELMTLPGYTQIQDVEAGA